MAWPAASREEGALGEREAGGINVCPADTRAKSHEVRLSVILRGMLEDNFTKTKSDILKDTTTENQRLDLERKRNEEQRRAAQLKYEKEQA
jgi:hypothetical protein